MDLKETLNHLGFRSVVSALDQDDSGIQGTINLLASLSDEPYPLSVATWDGAHKGIDDAHRAGVAVRLEPAADWLESQTPEVQPEVKPALPTPGSPLINGYTGLEILKGDWPSPPMIVPAMIPTGLSLIAGKAKIGKSFFVLDLCISIATGTPFLSDDIVVEEGKVLYLAFEDTPRAIASRIGNLMRGRTHLEGKLGENLIVFPSTMRVPRMPTGMKWLQAKLESIPCRLVVIDTLERFRPTDSDGSKHSYTGDYEILEEFKTWCELRGIAVLLVHHVRKNVKDADDIFDNILGSTGILGCPDTLLLLTRTNGKEIGRLYAKGREVQHVEHAMYFDEGSGQWSINPDAAQSQAEKVTPVKFLTGLFEASPRLLATDVIAEGEKHSFSRSMLVRFKDKLPFSLKSQKIGDVWYWIKEGEDS